MTPVPHAGTARRFPLVPRAKPRCLPLDVRVRQVADLADTAAGNPQEAAKAAAQAHNLGALIASDCGLPNLARTLCRTQFEIFHHARPVPAATAKLALQPLINLGRLHARNGDGAAAHQHIQALFTAVRHHQAVTLDGIDTEPGDLTATPEDHREIVRWLWTVLLADGTRALAQAGHWSQALHHVHGHNGIGQAILDGRQIAIIAHHAAGDHKTSARLLAQTPTPTAWEQAVAACLALLTKAPHSSTDTAATSYLALTGPTPQVVFRTRLGLALLDLIDLIDLIDHRHTPQIAHAIETDVLQARDAYAAREILTRTGHAPPFTETETLTGLVSAAGLDAGAMPARLLEPFTATMTRAETTLAEAIDSASCGATPRPGGACSRLRSSEGSRP